MGGNIKFLTPTRRYSKEEYISALNDIVHGLTDEIFTYHDLPVQQNIQVIKSYHNKESFGDMDIVVNSKYLEPNWIDRIVSYFSLKVGDWSKNGNVFSFVYEQLQVDLIITKDENFQTSLDYYGFNDLGNLLGRQSKRIGIKFGHEGSYIIVKDNDYVLGEILVTKETSEIFDILGLDYSTWLEGFDTLEDIFKFVASGKYFNPDIYLLENRNATSRERDRKRKTYNEFLKWCETYDGTRFQHTEKSERNGYNIVQPYFEEVIVPRFPHVLEEYNNIMKRYEETKALKEKFNGKIIHELLGIEGKDIGMFMAWAREVIDRTALKDMFINYTQHTCNQMIKSLYFHYINGIEFGKIPWELAIRIARNEGMVK